MKIAKGDKIFVEVGKKIPVDHRAFAYFGYEREPSDAFFNFMKGYRLACEKLYDCYLNLPRHDTASVDKLVYPLWFLLRHTAELNIKYLYAQYGDRDKLKEIIDKGHDLRQAWNTLKFPLKKLLKKQCITLDIEAVDSYIDQIMEFDPESHAMRYPVKKDVTKMHKTSHRFYVTNMYMRMKQLFDYFAFIDGTLICTIKNNFVEYEVKDRIITEYHNARDNINEIVDLLRQGKEVKSTEYSDDIGNAPFGSIYFSDIVGETTEHKKIRDQLFNILYKLSHNEAVILMLLIYAGRDIEDGCILAKSDNERKSDFISLMAMHFDEENEFDKENVNRYDVVSLFDSASFERLFCYLTTAQNEIEAF